MKTEKKNLETLNEQAAYVRMGGNLRVFSPADIIKLQEHALNIKDIHLYDYLEKYWKMV